MSRTLSVAITLILGIVASGVAIADSTIVILRHGEKPAQGLGQLSCRGLNRALALPKILTGRYGNPVAIYAPNPAIKKDDKGISYAYIRPLATVEPLAISTGLPVSIEWGLTDIKPLAAKLLELDEGIQVVAWEHHWAEALARLLLTNAGGDPSAVTPWQDSDYDSLLVIRITHNISGQRHVLYSHEQEGLQNISDVCP